MLYLKEILFNPIPFGVCHAHYLMGEGHIDNIEALWVSDNTLCKELLPIGKPPAQLNTTSTSGGFYTKMTFHPPVLPIPILENYLNQL